MRDAAVDRFTRPNGTEEMKTSSGSGASIQMFLSDHVELYKDSIALRPSKFRSFKSVLIFSYFSSTIQRGPLVWPGLRCRSVRRWVLKIFPHLNAKREGFIFLKILAVLCLRTLVA